MEVLHNKPRVAGPYFPTTICISLITVLAVYRSNSSGLKLHKHKVAITALRPNITVVKEHKSS